MGVLDGRVACITGGTRGIGLGIAKGFLDEGASVVVNGRDPSKAERTLAELDAGDRVHFIAGDVKLRESCEAIVDGTVEHFGRIDIVVANAGGGVRTRPGRRPHRRGDAGRPGLELLAHVLDDASRVPLHDPAAVRPLHEREFARGQGRQAGHLDLRRGEARDQRSHQVGRARGRHARASRSTRCAREPSRPTS